MAPRLTGKPMSRGDMSYRILRMTYDLSLRLSPHPQTSRRIICVFVDGVGTPANKERKQMRVGAFRSVLYSLRERAYPYVRAVVG